MQARERDRQLTGGEHTSEIVQQAASIGAANLDDHAFTDPIIEKADARRHLMSTSARRRRAYTASDRVMQRGLQHPAAVDANEAGATIVKDEAIKGLVIGAHVEAGIEYVDALA